MNEQTNTPLDTPQTGVPSESNQNNEVQLPEGSPIKYLELLEDTWDLAKTKLWPLLGINFVALIGLFVAIILSLIPIGLLFGFALLSKIPALVVIATILGIIGFLAVVIWISAWGIVSSLMYLENPGKIRLIMTEAWQKTKQLMPTFYLQVLIPFGGFFLLVIPGIILSIRTVLMPFMAVNERKTMWNAVKGSRDLTGGRLGNLFWLSIIFVFAFIALMLMTGYNSSPIIIISTPLGYLFLYLIYKKVRSEKPIKDISNNSLWPYQLSLVVAVLAIVASMIFGVRWAGSDWNEFKERFETPAVEDQEFAPDADFENWEWDYNPNNMLDPEV